MTPGRAVLAIAALLFFWQLGGHDLWAPDEPYFAEGAREMVADGEWAVPHVNGVVTTDKPPLFFWLIALFSLPGGAVTSWTARLPSALAGLGVLALTLRLGRRLYGPRTATLAAAVLATAYLFWQKARWSQIDALLCLLIWVALSAFEAWRAGDADGTRAGLLFWLAAALAVLAKGPVGLLLPLGIALTTLAADRRLRLWRRFAPLRGPLVFALLVGAWSALATFGSGGDYSVWGALREHFIDRGIHGLHHRQPPWYFLTTLPVHLLPWTGLLPGALILAWRRRGPAERFLLTAAFFVLALFSLSTEKRGLYILPAFPALALLIGSLVATACGWREVRGAQAGEPAPTGRDRLWLFAGQAATGILFALAGAAAIALAGRIEELPRLTVLPLAGAMLAGGVATVELVRRRRPLGAALAPAVGIGVLYLLGVSLAYPALESRKSARPFAQRLAAETAGSRARGLPVLAWGLGNLPEPFAFYSNGVYTLETYDPAVVRRHLERPERVFAVINGDLLETLPEPLRRRLIVVESARLARRSVLLVTNRPASSGERRRAPGAAR